MEDDKKPVPIGLRVNPDLAAWLKKEAEESQRSVSSQAAWALGQFRKQQEGQSATT